MPTARLDVEVPPDTWIGDVSRAFPDASFRVLAALKNSETGSGLVEIRGEALDELIAAVESHDGITALDLLEAGEDRALLRFTTESPMLLTAASEAGFPLETPFAIEDGVAEWELTGTRERMSELADALRGMGIDFDVDYVGAADDGEPLLSERQREAVETALDRGYYDAPRGITLSELADEMDVAKSTLSEVLHRAEGAILRDWLDGDG